MNPCTNAFYITSLACNLFQCLSEDEAAVLAADLVQLGDTLAAMQARADLCNDRNSTDD